MRVSIAINNYNYRQFVGQAIDSALAQTHPDVEVIVVDDGSTDGSQEVIGRYAGRIKSVEQPNGGQGSAYNAGFLQATGDIVLFLDADDWLYPEAAAATVAAWHAGVAKVQFALDLVDREGRSMGRHVPRHMHDREALALLRRFGAYGSPPASGNAFGAGFLRRVLPMDAVDWRTAADTVPILLAPAFGEVVSIGRSLGAYRQHRRADGPGLVSNNAPTGLWNEYERITTTKRFVSRSLAALGEDVAQPMLMAPWEARIAALCARFGEAAPAGTTTERPAARRLAVQALASVWRWPLAGLRMKALLSAWMMAMWLLPRPLAHRLARLHKASVGAAGAA